MAKSLEYLHWFQKKLSTYNIWLLLPLGVIYLSASIFNPLFLPTVPMLFATDMLTKAGIVLAQCTLQKLSGPQLDKMAFYFGWMTRQRILIPITDRPNMERQRGLMTFAAERGNHCAIAYNAQAVDRTAWTDKWWWDVDGAYSREVDGGWFWNGKSEYHKFVKSRFYTIGDPYTVYHLSAYECPISSGSSISDTYYARKLNALMLSLETDTMETFDDTPASNLLCSVYNRLHERGPLNARMASAFHKALFTDGEFTLDIDPPAATTTPAFEATRARHERAAARERAFAAGEEYKEEAP